MVDWPCCAEFRPWLIGWRKSGLLVMLVNRPKRLVHGSTDQIPASFICPAINCGVMISHLQQEQFNVFKESGQIGTNIVLPAPFLKVIGLQPLAWPRGLAMAGLLLTLLMRLWPHEIRLVNELASVALEQLDRHFWPKPLSKNIRKNRPHTI